MNAKPFHRYPNTDKSDKKERQCFMCGKTKLMGKYQRYCSKVCRAKATEIESSDINYLFGGTS